MEAREAKEKLEKSLDPKRPYTVADAAAASALSLADAERGLHALTSEYRGHLRVTEEGQLVFVFPHGFAKPWQTPDALAAAARRVWGAIAGAGRFIVRAWVAIVLVAYVAIFIALLIGLAFSKSERSEGRGLSFAGPLLRLVFDALFWTLHPWSPFYVDVGDVMQRRRQRRMAAADGPPFYERVDRFFFGPRPERPDPDAHRRAVIAEIRAGRGRIGLADVMRVTGASREQIDPMMSKLLLDFGGSVEVSEEGGIAYSFPELRKTAAVEAFGMSSRADPVWQRWEQPTPVTGNEPGQDVLIGGLNLFNLIASGWVIAGGLTIERIVAMIQGVPPIDMPPPGLPIALGVVPFLFSLALFLLPLSRLVLKPWRAKRAARENGRRAILRAVLENVGRGGVSERDIVERYRIAAGAEPDPKELTKQIVALGGDVDLERAGEGIRYRFPDLELEAKAVEAEREQASEDEAKLGPVVFTSEPEPTRP